jgi:glutaconate CoA-transferase subunit A
MQNKVATMQDAVALVRDGDMIAFGGMTIYRRPVAFARALVGLAEPPRDLILLAFTGGLASDILVGAGLVSQTRTCYFGLESFGLAPMFTNAVQSGAVTVIEESEASIACGLRAALAGVGFMPSRAWQGTDMLRVRADVQTIRDPYTGQPLTAFPAIKPDIAIIHALRADASGNAHLGGNSTIDFELALAAGQVVLTAEQIVERLDAPYELPGQTTTMVVHAPYGAWPTSCYPLYPLDGEAILDYVDACRESRFREYLATLATPEAAAAKV